MPQGLRRATNLPGLFLVLLSILYGPNSVAAQADLRVVRLDDGIVDLVRLDQDGETALIVVGRKGAAMAVTIDGKRVTLAPFGPLPAKATAANLLPQSRVARGRRDIVAAWLAVPTDRYDHGVLGDRLEAAELHATDRNGAVARVALGPDMVFEDLKPRIADIDGDGRDEIFVVRSSRTRGAALVAYRRHADRLVLVAETPAIGRPYRWLNPVGVADFDGDGEREVAVVATPHIGGWLRLYGLDGARLVLEGESFGYSNHRMGSTRLGLSAIVDIEGDGKAEIILPDQSRQRLAVVRFDGKVFTQRWLARHDMEIATDIVLWRQDGRLYLAYGLGADRLILLGLPEAAKQVIP
jgi:hypothetical protein